MLEAAAAAASTLLEDALALPAGTVVGGGIGGAGGGQVTLANAAILAPLLLPRFAASATAVRCTAHSLLKSRFDI